jgi:hypothetical protein
MSTLLLFEDSDLSKLGQYLLKSYNFSNIKFARGDTRLYKSILKYENLYDLIVVFYDIVPNNNSILDSLSSLCSKLISRRNYCDIFIVPIPCLEYIYMYNMNTSYFSTSQEFFTVKSYKTFEKLCKHLIKSFKIDSFKNPDEFYASLPVFDVLDDKHKAYLNDMNIVTKSVDFDYVRAKVLNFYISFYSEYMNIDFMKILNDFHAINILNVIDIK